MRIRALFITCVFVAASAFGGTYTVMRVVDGDTFDIAVPVKGGEAKLERVRLLGIDAPELAHFGRPEECYAQGSTEQLRGAIEGKKVRVVRCATCGKKGKDVFGRTLAFAYYVGPDAHLYGPAMERHSIGQYMLRNGYAIYNTRYPPPAKYRTAYKASQAFAQGTGPWPDDPKIRGGGRQGLWQMCLGATGPMAVPHGEQ